MVAPVQGLSPPLEQEEYRRLKAGLAKVNAALRQEYGDSIRSRYNYKEPNWELLADQLDNLVRWIDDEQVYHWHIALPLLRAVAATLQKLRWPGHENGPSYEQVAHEVIEQIGHVADSVAEDMDRVPCPRGRRKHLKELGAVMRRAREAIGPLSSSR